MRSFRILLGFVPYVAVLGALAAAGLWYAFWVVAVVTLTVIVASILFSWRVHRRAAQGRRISGVEWANLVARRWWILGLVGAAFSTAAFFPGLRKEAWWITPLYAVVAFVALGMVIRLSARLTAGYERQFERFTRGRSSPGPGSARKEP